MKKFRFIFFLISFSGITLTIFQYLPGFEEETQSIELSKKGSEDNSSSDDENEKDSSEGLSHQFNYTFTNHFSILNSFFSNTNDYYSFFQRINIPPPKNFFFLA
ncbi:MAG: hypothetical protein Q7W45_16095 [Bacteroidota bacterium]|nr:hypothetical protein [Bacteroidota bacterium]MDP3145462.1 hypothetical protein [Bacteroidota bacterium]MDP3556418.1 hypothetical protein [Bacteroidota bacterium]